MQKRLAHFLFALIAVLVLLVPSTALAQDADAKKLQKKAMDEDYLGTDYAAAEKKLNQAI